MKKNYLLIIALIISLLFGTYTFLDRANDKKNVNELFLCELDQVQQCFASDHNKMSENEKTSYYMEASSNLYAALSISRFTSYYNIENFNELINALNKLHFCISDSHAINNKWDIISENSSLICDYIHNICINPNDKNSCESLEKLIKKIYLSEMDSEEK